MIVEKLFAGGTTLFVGLVCFALFLASKRAPIGGHAVIIAGSVAAAAGAVGVFALRKTGFLKRALDRLPPLSPPQAGVLACYSVFIHICLLAQTSLLLWTFGSNAFFFNMLAGGQAYVFMLFFPVFIANMGIREYSFGMFLGSAQSTPPAAGLPAIAFGASMGILIINIILPAIIGLAWWILEKKLVAGSPLPVTSKKED